MILNGFDSETNDFVENYADMLKEFKTADPNYSEDEDSRYNSYISKIEECLDWDGDDNKDLIKKLKALNVLNCFLMEGKSSKYKIDKDFYEEQDREFRENYPEGIMIHCPAGGSKAVDVRNSLIKKEATVHFIIEYDKTCNIFSFRPISYRTGHCYHGYNGSFNDSMIGIEVCDPPQLKVIKDVKKIPPEAKYIKIGHSYYCITDVEGARDYHAEVREGAIDLCAMLCSLLELDIHDSGFLPQSAVIELPDGTTEDYSIQKEESVGNFRKRIKKRVDRINKKILDKKQEENGFAEVSYDGLNYPITVISHREGNMNYHKTSDHQDPDKLWILYKYMCDPDFVSGDVLSYLESRGLNIKNEFYDFYQNEIMDPFREEVAERLELYNNGFEAIHPLLRLMFRKALIDWEHK